MSGTKIKKMYILAVLAIIFIFIMHIISWTPIISEADEVRENWNEHKHNYSYYTSHDYSDCDNCKSYEEKIDQYNKMGADLWQNTVTNCVLIAFAGAITYGVGIMVEKNQEAKS